MVAKRCCLNWTNNGYVYEVDIKNIGRISKPSFKSFTKEDFVKTCILAGCDYLDSIKGVGFKKAHKYMSKMKERGLKYIIQELRKKPNFQVPIDYEHQFNLARLTFKYQLVYGPRREQIVHLNEPEDDIKKFLELSMKNKRYEAIKKMLCTPRKWKKLDIGKKIAMSEIDPISHKPFSEVVTTTKPSYSCIRK